MDIIANLVSQYKSEMDTVIKKAMNIDLQAKIQEYKKKTDEMKPKLEIIKDEFIKVVTSQAPLAEIDRSKFINTCAWISVMLLSFTICGIFGSMFSPVIGLFLSGFCLLVTAYLALPILVVYEINQVPAEEADVRHGLLAFAALEGLFLGAVFSRLTVGIPPLAAIGPITIALTSQLAQSIIGNDRTKLLAVTLGSSLVAHVIIGLAVGLYFPYLLLTVLYSVISFVFLQIYTQEVTSETANTHLYQLGYFYAVIFTQALVYSIFGSHPEDVQ